MQAIVREELPHLTMTKSIPVKVMKVEKGKVVFNAIVNNRNLNTQCGVHGGFVSTVLDYVTGCAVHTLLGAGAPYGTIDLNIKMIRPVPKACNKGKRVFSETVCSQRFLRISNI